MCAISLEWEWYVTVKDIPPPSPPPDEVFLVASVRVSVQKFKETEIQQSNIRGIPYLKNVVAWSHSVAPNNPIGCCWHISLQDGYTKGKHWGQHIQFSCELISGWTHLYCSYTENKKKAGKNVLWLRVGYRGLCSCFYFGVHNARKKK